MLPDVKDYNKIIQLNDFGMCFLHIFARAKKIRNGGYGAVYLSLKIDRNPSGIDVYAFVLLIYIKIQL